MIIKDNLRIEIAVNKAYRIQTGRDKSIVVAEMENWEQKREIMGRKKDLKAGIFIDNNLTRMEREMQEQLRAEARKEKDKGNKVKVNYGKLRVNDRWLWWKEKEKKLEEDKGRKAE